MQRIRQNSSLVRALEEGGQVMIVGGMYEMKTGEVEFLD